MPRASHEIKSGNFRDVRQRVRKIFNPSERTFRTEVTVTEKSIFLRDAFWFFATFDLVTSHILVRRKRDVVFLLLYFFTLLPVNKISRLFITSIRLLDSINKKLYIRYKRNTSLNNATISLILYVRKCHLKKIPLALHACKI